MTDSFLAWRLFKDAAGFRSELTERRLTEIYSAERPLRLFRQMKMYNDPTMNPYLYKTAAKAA